MAYPSTSGSPYVRVPHGADPSPYGPAAPTPKGRKGPLILLLSGVALCVIAGIAIIVSALSLTRTAGALQPIVADGTSTVRLDAQEVYGLYGNGSSDCAVTAADGTELEVTRPSSSITVNDRQLFGMIAPTSSGEYTITCSTLLVSGDVYFGPLVGAQDIGRMVFGVIASIAMLVLGIPLTIGGIIWLVVRNSHNKRALQAQAVYPTAGTGL
ncbi:hypothetical protein [Actinomyces ruminis]|uniref:Serine/threonine protein kinase n=1 Tax=Actinomyces ruminis TaxID=1937003 RepID=A0ABX4MHJ4_9ACTO|nr:hypothetical protein [Actinomyces ruminis]PHP53662.1 hypothetical protein BW737_001485 [Actinomyces ruminis]